MDKKPLIGVSICVVVVLVLASLSNVVGYQTVESSHQTVVNNEVNQKELVFQTIVDITNNKEIQGILLRYQMSQGKLPDTTIPVLTIKQLKQMYVVGLILSKTISKTKIHSMIEKYPMYSQGVQNEINAVIQKDTALNGKITQLSNSECGCENENTTKWDIPIICKLFFLFGIIGSYVFGELDIFIWFAGIVYLSICVWIFS
jgi:hypothetical protein